MLFQSNDISKDEDMEYISRLISGVLKIPIHIIDRDGNTLYEFNYGYINNPLYRDKKEQFNQLFQHNGNINFPVLITTKYHENYFSIGVERDDVFLGTIIVGPSISSEVNGDTINSLITDFNIPLRYKRDLYNYYERIQIVDYIKLINASILLYYIIYNKKLDPAAVIEHNSSFKSTAVNIENDIELNISQNRQNKFLHHTYANESILMRCIEKGDKEGLLKLLGKPFDGEPGILSRSNPLRSQKNLVICAAAVASRAAIVGGLSSELAFTVSDSYIQQLEELHDIKDITNLHFKMLLDFTERVSRVREFNYSKAISNCQDYISKHLYEDISLPQLAKAVNMNSNYLSELFKKEVGIPVSEYIQKMRIDEAKKLLVLPNYTILDIYTCLNFSDQSYFTKIFKKLTGLTPKQYRNRYAELQQTVH